MIDFLAPELAALLDGPHACFRPWAWEGRSPQREFILGAALYRALVMRAGNRAGKTAVASWSVAAAARGVHPAIPTRPPLAIWVSGLDREFGIGQVIWPALKRWIPEREIVGRAWFRREPEIPTSIRLRNGSQIDFKSADSGAGKYQGASQDLVWMDEEHPADVVEEARARLLDRPNGRLLVTCTPLLRSAWLQDLEREDETLVVRASMLDAARAGVIDLQAVQAYLDALPDSQRRVRELGDIVALEGAVYRGFSSKTHVARPRGGALWIGDKRVCEWPIPESWPRYAAADFGVNHPMAVGRAAHDGAAGRLIFERCWWASGFSFSRWAEHLRPELRRLAGPLICDRDASGRAEFEAAGIATTPARKGVRPGIELFERLLEPAKDGLPRLVFVEDPTLRSDALGRCDCKRLVWELEHLHYPHDGEGKPLKADAPVKRDDDCADMARYLGAGVVAWTTPERDDHDGLVRRIRLT